MADNVTVTPWPRWLAPAVVLGLCSAAYGVGLFNGEQRYAVQLSRMEQQIIAHQSLDVHDGAVRVDTYRVEIRSLEAKLDRMDMQLTRIVDMLGPR